MDSVELNTIPQYADLLGFEVLHPQISVIDLEKMPSDLIGRKRFGFYCVLLKDHYNGRISYGRGHYEYQAGTMIFTSPGQVIGIDMEGEDNHSKGYFLMIHPDFLVSTPLANRIKDYFFFAYDVNEALQMSENEKETILNLFRSIEGELRATHDTHTRTIVVSYIETMLNYCLRFFDRQFAMSKTDSTNIISRFEKVLTEYYSKDMAAELGVPSVSYCAGCMNLSPNYFGELIKKETGRSPQQFIHSFIIDKAKFHLLSTSMNISEVAYHLGFCYPHHFSRLFKKHTGMSPIEFKHSGNNLRSL